MEIQQQLRPAPNVESGSESDSVEIDTNIFSIGFDILKNSQQNLGLGDPTFCGNCLAVLNSNSKVLNKDEYQKLWQQQKKKQPLKKIFKEDIIEEEEEEEKKMDEKSYVVVDKSQLQEELDENEKCWICEFCGHFNKLNIELEEIPEKDDMIYIIQSVNQVIEEKIDQQSDISIMFVIDNSGSMSATTLYQYLGQQKFKHGLSKEEYEMLKQFIEPGAENQQFLPHQNKNTTHVSRKQCVIAAIESQINEMKKLNPNRKVGLVTFNNDVVMIGDGMADPIFIAGDRLNKFEEIKEFAENNASKLMTTPIVKSVENLLQKFEKLEETGKTALGPALLAAVGMLHGSKHGSMLLLCTDGLANYGLGAIENQNEDVAAQFYNEVALLARDMGIGEACKVAILNPLVQMTNGNVKRINPEELQNDFANILEDELVATNVQLDIRLHQALQFRNEDPSCLSNEGSQCKKTIGNATVNTEINFEYTTKKDVELQKLKLDLNELKEVPFQAQIHYTTLEGHKFMRVLTKFQKVTQEKQQAEQFAQAELIHQHIIQKSSNYARVGALYTFILNTYKKNERSLSLEQKIC